MSIHGSRNNCHPPVVVCLKGFCLKEIHARVFIAVNSVPFFALWELPEDTETWTADHKQFYHSTKLVAFVFPFHTTVSKLKAQHKPRQYFILSLQIRTPLITKLTLDMF